MALAGCATSSNSRSGVTASTNVAFTKHIVTLGTTNTPTILTGRFLNRSTSDLAVVGVGENGAKSLQFVSLNLGEWQLGIKHSLPQATEFVDVIKLDGRDRLLVYEPAKFSWFDSDAMTLRQLAEAEFNSTNTSQNSVQWIEITRDLNGDGRDDIQLPAFGGFQIALQLDGGEFSDWIQVGPPEPFLAEVAVEDGVAYRDVGLTARSIPQYLSRVHQFDFNRDGRIDLVFWNEDHFDIHLQQPDGHFSTKPIRYDVDVELDADGVYSHMFGYDDKNGLALFMGTRAKTRHTVLYAFKDLNGDGVIDLVTHTLEGRSLIKMRSSLAAHYGRNEDGRLQFSKEPEATFGPKGSQPMGYAGQRIQDLDGDGQMEVALVNVDAGIADMFQVMLANSIDIDVHVFRAQDGVYPEKPTYSRRVKPADKLFGKRDPFFPPVLGDDVNGDGYDDLIVGHSRNELRVYPGGPGDELFSREPVLIEVELPGDERDVWLDDLNGDGNQDLLIKLRSKDGPHRVTVLISQ